MKRPNILFILTDTQPTHFIGAYSAFPVQTPHIDSLATKGIRFDRAYTTCPLCTPARSAIFTGMTPSRNGAYTNDQPLGLHIKTMGERLTHAGYRCAYSGKWHLDAQDYFGSGQCPPGWDDAYWFDGKRYLLSLSPHERDLWRTEWANLDGLKKHRVTSEQTWAHRISSLAESFLAEQAGDSRPFLLVTSYDEPHHPWTCPPEFVEAFQNVELPIGPSASDTLENKPRIQQDWASSHLGVGPTPRTAYHHPMMLGCNAYLDTQIGRVIHAAQNLCARKNEQLWIFFTSDHGDHLGTHRLTNKGPTGYEANTRIPFLILPPNGSKPIVQPSIISHLDILPTFLDLAGLPIPPSLDGQSLLPLTTTDTIDSSRTAFTEYTRYETGHDGFGGLHPMRMLVRENWKLVLNLHDTDELYDLRSDPHELHNLIYDPSHTSTRNDLHTQLIQWMDDHIDPQRGYPWQNRPWHSIPTNRWKAPFRPHKPDGYHPPYLDYDTAQPTRGVAIQYE